MCALKLLKARLTGAMVELFISIFFKASGTCYNVTAPETSCMQAANIKGFTGRTAVQRIERKHKSPGLSPLGVSEEVFVNKLMSGGTSIKKISEKQG